MKQFLFTLWLLILAFSIYAQREPANNDQQLRDSTIQDTQKSVQNHKGSTIQVAALTTIIVSCAVIIIVKKKKKQTN